MSEVFLPAAMLEAGLLGLLGTGADGSAGQKAVLEGYALVDAGTRTGLAASVGAQVAGRLVRLGAETGIRLDFLMRALGAEPAAVAVRGGSGAAPALVWRLGEAEGARSWEKQDALALARFEETAREVMDHFGRRAPQEMAALVPGIAFRAFARARARTGPAPPAGPGRGFGAEDVEAEPPVRAYAGFFGVEEHRLRHRRFDGAMSEVVFRAVFASGDAVTVLPFDPERGAVLLIEQFRPGALARCDPGPWFLEAIAGRIDAGETSEATARREAREEAGLPLGRMRRVAGYYTSPGISAEHVTAFVAEADLGAAGGTHGLASEAEDIRVLVLPLGEALDLVEGGVARNAPLLIPLLWLGQHHARLAAEWAGPPGPLDGEARSR